MIVDVYDGTNKEPETSFTPLKDFLVMIKEYAFRNNK